MRGAIAGFAAACAAGAGIVAYGATTATTSGEGQQWRQRELAFLSATYERIGAELALQQREAARDTLREIQASLRQTIVAVSRPLPADSIPPGVKALLSVSETRTDKAAAAVVRTPDRGPELRIGLNLSRASVPDGLSLTMDPLLAMPLRPAKKHRAPAAPEGSAKSAP